MKTKNQNRLVKSVIASVWILSGVGIVSNIGCHKQKESQESGTETRMESSSDESVTETLQESGSESNTSGNETGIEECGELLDPCSMIVNDCCVGLICSIGYCIPQ